MLTSIKPFTKDNQLTAFQKHQIAKEKTKQLKGGNIIVEEIVLG